MNPEARRQFERRLAEIRQGFLQHLARHTSEIEDLATELARSTDPSLLKRVHRTIHSLAGTACTFKIFPLGSEARELAHYLATLGDWSAAPTDVRDEVSVRMRRVTVLARAVAEARKSDGDAKAERSGACVQSDGGGGG